MATHDIELPGKRDWVQRNVGAQSFHYRNGMAPAHRPAGLARSYRNARANPGERYVVPKGVDHKPFAREEVRLLLIEPRGVVNTGDQGGDRTAQNDVWI